jgi:hypothetical protein
MKYLKYYDSSAEYDSNFGNDYVEPFLGYVNGESLVLYNKVKYVDLGLPSGILWAICDIGSSSPEIRGYNFAWGEISPKSEFSWNNYKYGTAASDSSMTKYNSRDKLTTLELEDDAAYVNMGESWRMPTADEANEILQYTTRKITDTTTDKRVVFTSIFNGNTITFPIGFGVWTSTRYPTTYFSYDANALTMDYKSSSWGISVSSMMARYRGYCIRGVCSSSKN